MKPPPTGAVSQLERDRAELSPLGYKSDGLATWLFVTAVVVPILKALVGRRDF